eukprot:6214061-Pleurochrysis_carterae.AAC.1
MISHSRRLPTLRCYWNDAMSRCLMDHRQGSFAACRWVRCSRRGGGGRLHLACPLHAPRSSPALRAAAKARL